MCASLGKRKKKKSNKAWEKREQVKPTDRKQEGMHRKRSTERKHLYEKTKKKSKIKHRGEKGEWNVENYAEGRGGGGKE